MLQLLRHYAQSDTLIRQLWDPLCLAALNTPTAQASAGLYARVLRDSLGGRREASDLLLPCTDLSALWPDAAARHLTMRYGSTVRQLQPRKTAWSSTRSASTPPCWPCRPPRRAPAGRALREAGAGGLLDALVLRLPADRHAESPAGRPRRLPEPMMMLREDPRAAIWAMVVRPRAPGR